MTRDPFPMTPDVPPPLDRVAALKPLDTLARQAAKQEALQALQAWAGSASPHDAAAAHHDVAVQFYMLGLYDDCVRQARHAATAWQALDEPGRRCQSVCLQALALSDLGQDDEAVGCAADALTAARGADASKGASPGASPSASPGLWLAITLLGKLQGRQGEFEAGEDLLMQAMQHTRAQRDRRGLVRALISMIGLLVTAHDVQATAGDDETARQTRARLLAQTRETLFLCADEPGPYLRVVMRSNAAAGLMTAGFVDDAVDLLRQSVQQARAEGFRIVELRSRSRLARCLQRQGRFDAAHRELRSILQALDVDDIPRLRHEALTLLVEVCLAAGDEHAAHLYGVLAREGQQRLADTAALARERLQPAVRSAREALAQAA